MNVKFQTNFTSQNIKNHYRTLKARYVEIKKAWDLSGVSHDEKNKMIIPDQIVVFTYTEV